MFRTIFKFVELNWPQGVMIVASRHGTPISVIFLLLCAHKERDRTLIHLFNWWFVWLFSKIYSLPRNHTTGRVRKCRPWNSLLKWWFRHGFSWILKKRYLATWDWPNVLKNLWFRSNFFDLIFDFKEILIRFHFSNFTHYI